MRPVRLEVSGFGVFREPTTVDFEGADFFALVGPTGSGKSTVIDAICFALYGSVPRYDDRRLVAPIITMGAQEARVSLTFDVGGERYVAARVVRRTKTGATTPEARLERVRDGASLAGRANDMEAAVVAVLGLPFAHFTKCVVLPQGDFARFLHDKPAERQKLLVELLNLGVYARMGQEARALAAEKEVEVNLDRRRLEELAELATDEHKRAVEQRVGACGRLAADLQSARGALEQLTKAGDDADREAQRATELVALLRNVKVPLEVAELAQQRADADGALDTAVAKVAEATAAVRSTRRPSRSCPILPCCSWRVTGTAILPRCATRSRRRRRRSPTPSSEKLTRPRLRRGPGPSGRSPRGPGSAPNRAPRPLGRADAARRRTVPGLQPDRHDHPEAHEAGRGEARRRRRSARREGARVRRQAAGSEPQRARIDPHRDRRSAPTRGRDASQGGGASRRRRRAGCARGGAVGAAGARPRAPRRRHGPSRGRSRAHDGRVVRRSHEGGGGPVPCPARAVAAQRRRPPRPARRSPRRLEPLGRVGRRRASGPPRSGPRRA